MNCLISGGNGFVAKSILNYIDDQLVFDNIGIITRSPDKVIFKSHKNIRIYNHNEIIDGDFDSSIKYDIYFHAISAPRSLKNDRFFVNEDLLSSYLEVCANIGIKSIVYFSSGAVRNHGEVFCNKSNNTNHKIHYAHHKIKSEQFVVNFCKRNLISYKIFRLYTFSGSHLLNRNEFAISQMITQALSEGVITINSPTTVRSYLDQDDMARNIINSSIKNLDSNSIKDIGSDKPINMFELANLIASVIRRVCNKEVSVLVENFNNSSYDSYLPDGKNIESDGSAKTLEQSIEVMIKKYVSS